MTSAHNDRFDSMVSGVCPVLATPFMDDGSIDEEGFDSLIEYVAGTGVTAVLWPALASESYKLSDNERRKLRGRLLRSSRDLDPSVVIGVAQHSTHHAIEDARAAFDEGAIAINLLPPHFLNPSKSSVLQHLEAVLDAVTPLPVIIQYAPSLVGTQISAEEFLTLARSHSNLRMMKVEVVPPGRFIHLLKEGSPSLPSMVGYAGVLMMDSLRRGAVGVQPGCSFTEIYKLIWDAFNRGDVTDADDLHTRLLPYISYWMSDIELLIQTEKMILKRRGMIGSDHCRAPGRVLDQRELDLIDRFMSTFEDLIPVI